MKAPAVAVWVGLAGAAWTQQGEEFDHGELRNLLEYDAEAKESLLGGWGALESYEDFKERLRERAGVGYMIEYAPILQWGAGEWHADHELNLIGQWTPFEAENGDKGELLGWFQNGATLGGLNGSEFAGELGALAPVNGGTPFANHNVLQHLAWEQTLGGGDWRLMAGKITSRVTFNTNRYAVSDREDFFTPMIVNNPVAHYTARNGLGLFAQRRTDDWYASAMVRDADADSTGIDFDSVSSGNWETLAEFALTPEIEGSGAGQYRLTWSYTDAIGEGPGRQPSGSTLSLSADQDFGERVGALLRYAWADTPLRDFESRLAAGFQVKSPFQHPDDRWGLAYWTGEPSDPTLRREHGLESFYRIQVSDRVQLTPDLQFVFDPALDTDEDFRAVLGLRLRVVF